MCNVVRRVLFSLLPVWLLAACGGGADPVGPTVTPVPPTPATVPFENEQLGVTAELPAGPWFRNERSESDSGVTYVSQSGDAKYSFTLIEISKQLTGDVSRDYDLWVKGFQDALVPPTEVSDAEIAGYRSKRIEGLQSDPEKEADYRQIAHLVVVKGKILAIAVSVKTSEWDQGGRQVAEDILKSVRIR